MLMYFNELIFMFVLSNHDTKLQVFYEKNKKTSPKLMERLFFYDKRAIICPVVLLNIQMSRGHF